MVNLSKQYTIDFIGFQGTQCGWIICKVITFSIHIQDGLFPLYSASLAGNYEKVELLLQSGAEVDKESKVGISEY